MIKEEYKHSALTAAIIGCAMEVHRIIGSGFQEKIYQKALAKEFTLKGIHFSREYELPIFYKGERMGTRIVDFYVDGKIMLEIKAVSKLEDVHLAQAINYVEASGLEVGLLINFGNFSLQYKRVSKPKRR